MAVKLLSQYKRPLLILVLFLNIFFSATLVGTVRTINQSWAILASTGSVTYPSDPGEEANLHVLRFESKDTLGTLKSNAEFIVDITDMYMAGQWQTGLPEQIHAMDPSKKVIVYRDFMNIKENLSEWELALENRWILLDENGDYVYARNHPNNKVADRGSPSFRGYMASWIRSQIEMGFNGIFCDNSIQVYPNTQWTISARPINPRTGKLYTDDEWLEDCLGFINYMKREVPEALLICNGMPFNGRAFYNDESKLVYFLLNSEMDGKFMEGAFNNFDGVYSEEDWKKSVDCIIWFQENYLRDTGRYLVIWSQAKAIPEEFTQDQMALFIFASSLLAVSFDNQNYISLHGYMDSKLAEELFNLELGMPIEDYCIIEGTHVYKRDLTKIKVLVNPTSEIYTVTLDGTYLDLDGAFVSSVTLTGYTGTLLRAVG